MKVVITGGGGFLGSQLCEKIIERGSLAGQDGKQRTIEQIVLLDARFPTVHDSPIVRQVVGDIGAREVVFDAIGTGQETSVFHLASMVSGECEQRFDDALHVNLDGGLNVFEAARRVGRCPRVVFASSIACFGGDAMQTPCTDRDKLTPRTTYGTTKAICELLMNDYSRKGFIDGRSARLPTVIIRPGKPNAAASSWASGMFREPLHGQTCLLPVRRNQSHPMTGYRTVIDSLIAIHELPPEVFGDDRGLGLPAHRVTPEMAASTLTRMAHQNSLQIGSIEDAFDAHIQSIVDNWPTEIDGSRAVKLGLPLPPSLETIVSQYIEDFLN